jgi:hypothetical protein
MQAAESKYSTNAANVNNVAKKEIKNPFLMVIWPKMKCPNRLTATSPKQKQTRVLYTLESQPNCCAGRGALSWV